MEEASIAAISAAVISGLLGGGIAAAGAIWAVKAGVKDLEKTELRRQKILAVISLYGLRYVLNPGPVQRDEDRAHFMYEMNRACALFADDDKVQQTIRDFHAAIQEKEKLQREIAVHQQAGPYPEGAGRMQAVEDRTTDSLLKVIKDMSRSAKFPIPSVSDSELRTTFLLPLVNPNGISTVIIPPPQQPDPARPTASA